MLISCLSDADEMLIHGMVIDWFYFHGLFGTGDVQWICSEQVGSGALRPQSIPQWFAGCGFPPWHALGELHHRLQGDGMRYIMIHISHVFHERALGQTFCFQMHLIKRVILALDPGQTASNCSAWGEGKKVSAHEFNQRKQCKRRV